MKTTLAFVLTLALGATAPASATSIQVVASTATPTSGELFTITIQALNLFDGFQPLDLFYGFGFDVVNTPGTGGVTYQSATAGAGFELAPTLPADGSDVVGSTPAGFEITNPATEKLVLAILTFLAGTPGTVELGAIGIADPVNKPNAGLFYLRDLEVDLSVLDLQGTTPVTVQAAAVPETFSFGLPLGLMAIVGVRRLFRDR